MPCGADYGAVLSKAQLSVLCCRLSFLNPSLLRGGAAVLPPRTEKIQRMGPPPNDGARKLGMAMVWALSLGLFLFQRKAPA